jgi:hypothetical protein
VFVRRLKFIVRIGRRTLFYLRRWRASLTDGLAR